VPILTAPKPQPELDPERATPMTPPRLHAESESEAPTRDVHPTPCAALLAHIGSLVAIAKENGALRAYIISASIAACGAAGWLLFRGDSASERLATADEELARSGASREVAIRVVEARVANLDASMSRLEGAIGSLDGKLDALLAARTP
jgi:hypothetical protein